MIAANKPEVARSPVIGLPSTRTISVGRDPPLARKSKKGSDPEPIPLPSAISELRRVADEIGDLETRLWLLDRLLQDRMMDGPHTLPEILPLPEILLKPPRPVRKERQRRPRSSHR